MDDDNCRREAEPPPYTLWRPWPVGLGSPTFHFSVFNPFLKSVPDRRSSGVMVSQPARQRAPNASAGVCRECARA